MWTFEIQSWSKAKHHWSQNVKKSIYGLMWVHWTPIYEFVCVCTEKRTVQNLNFKRTRKTNFMRVYSMIWIRPLYLLGSMFVIYASYFRHAVRRKTLFFTDNCLVSWCWTGQSWHFEDFFFFFWKNL